MTIFGVKKTDYLIGLQIVEKGVFFLGNLFYFGQKRQNLINGQVDFRSRRSLSAGGPGASSSLTRLRGL
ncbi:MAG: hypothetical protein Q8934_11410, partial [Bacillota bacterium]|nr:hypothetical protein [Bacillota bacterium]